MKPAGPSPTERLGIGARVFGLVVLCGPILWSGGSVAGLALLVIGLTWTAATGAERLVPITAPLLVVEGALIGTVCGLSLDQTLAVLGALAVPPFTAALKRGLYGVLLMLSVETSTLVLVTTLALGPLDADAATGSFTWLVTGLGLGLIGTFLHSSITVREDPLTPYRDAQALIRELIDISGGLSSGLDPTSLAERIAGVVRDELPLRAITVQVPRDDQLTPLLLELDPDQPESTALDGLARQAGGSLRPERGGHTFAFPLVTDAGLTAVVAGSLTRRIEPEAIEMDRRMAQLMKRLAPTAVHLDTALLFTAFRDSATAGERRRLAREMHDGIAQDIASLGYVVDGLAARPASPQQAAQLRMLRERISAVVSDVRRSVKSLRHDLGESPSLGAAIAAIARHLSETSGIPIRVTADERTARLRTEVESELLRIAQEAMTNAVKHSRATLIEVHCIVQAPTAEIVVEDNGLGLGPKRPDSQGLEVMRERAHLIDASLTIDNKAPQGTRVTVQLPSRPQSPTEQPTTPQDRVAS